MDNQRHDASYHSIDIEKHADLIDIHNYLQNETIREEAESQAERAWKKALLGWLTFAEIGGRSEQVKVFDSKMRTRGRSDGSSPLGTALDLRIGYRLAQASTG